MKNRTAGATIALLLILGPPWSVYAQAGSSVSTKLQKDPARGQTVEDEYKAAKQRADAREKDWDRRVREKIKSICSGC
jgi:hypothetical protein